MTNEIEECGICGAEGRVAVPSSLDEPGGETGQYCHDCAPMMIASVAIKYGLTARMIAGEKRDRGTCDD